MPAIDGVTLRAVRAGYKDWDRADLTFAELAGGTAVAGVFTQNACASSEVELGREYVQQGRARALVVNPACVLMDEPTGNLDPASAAQVLQLIDELGEEQASFVVVTHDPEIAAHMHRTLELRDGGLWPRG